MFKINSEPNLFDDKSRSKSLSWTRTSPDTSSTSSVNFQSCYSTSSSQRRFHSSQLGRPPGVTSNQALKKSVSQATLKTNEIKLPTHQCSAQPKIAPLGEIDRLITNLKKENFDLKLRIFHLQEFIAKDFTLYQLNEENYQLRLALEDKNKRLKDIEQELAQKDTQPKEITFESSPEAFNLLPAPSHKNASWQRIVAHDKNLSSVVHALQEIRIDHKEDHVESWLNQTVTDHQQGMLRQPCL